MNSVNRLLFSVLAGGLGIYFLGVSLWYFCVFFVNAWELNIVASISALAFSILLSSLSGFLVRVANRILDIQ